MRRHYYLVLALGIVVALAGTVLPGAVRAADPWAGYYPTQSNPNTTVRGQDPGPGPGQPESCWQRFKRDYHRNSCWPEPFIAGDRAAVIMPFQIQTDNAWMRQNLLSDYHFVEGTSELNNAGLYRVSWILSRAPIQHRMAFVERLPSESATTDRVIAVQRAIARTRPHGMIPVYESNMEAGSWAGSDAEATLRARDKTVPDPHLPKANPTAISN